MTRSHAIPELRRTFSIFMLAVAFMALSAGLATSHAAAASTAAFLDRDILGPHNSRVTGDMIVDNWHWYGIDVLPQLVIIGTETSLGDPNLGGELVSANNFGCLRYHGVDTRWGELAAGKVWVSGKDWYSFSTPEIGMMALGRYLKVGRGLYGQLLDAPPYDWEAFAAAYYGSNVPGFAAYVRNLRSLERSFRGRAAAAGFGW